ncbi:hypothetical protein SKAU_G00124920 [Synaphobranchus kaupii]|uniref:Uncharacterized protein n=1 Tax=Synaphobranchus kaupii TaxID=118154 RepID=A0A9Q1FPT7_SYNKA|nr:hypothetical protein SKAU_G00124920 [Synaphobranchus kaupii]
MMAPSKRKHPSDAAKRQIKNRRQESAARESADQAQISKTFIIQDMFTDTGSNLKLHSMLAHGREPGSSLRIISLERMSEEEIRPC